MTRKPSPSPAVLVLRSRRQELGLSAQDLADRMTAHGYPMSRNTVTGIEIAKRGDITFTEMMHMCAVLDMDPHEFICACTDHEFCPVCHNSPPLGFQCLACGKTEHQRKQP